MTESNETELNEVTEPSYAEFIRSRFSTRYCYKYKGLAFKKCYCTRTKDQHEEIEELRTGWSYENNTKLTVCETFGEINFQDYEFVNRDRRKFIRFDVHEKVQDTAKHMCSLLTQKWKFFDPYFVISIEGGYKNMGRISYDHKKNFRQGIMDILVKDKTWLLGSGYNFGTDKLIGETVEEYRCYYEEKAKEVLLIGVSSWGIVKNRDELLKKKANNVFSYPYAINEPKNVVLDAHFDAFLFCDDGIENEYGKEREFKMEFQKYLEKSYDAKLVSILYEGGRRQIQIVHSILDKNMALVIVKGSGRAANLLSEILESECISNEEIEKMYKNYTKALKIPDEEFKKYLQHLCEIYHKYRNNVVIYDIENSNMKFDKQILKAIIIANEKRNLQTELKLSIKFNCPDIAEIRVFNNPEFSKIKKEELEVIFLDVMKRNLPEFVMLFIANGVMIKDVINYRNNMEMLYKRSIHENGTNFQVSEILNDIWESTKSIFFSNKKKGYLKTCGEIIEVLSGNIMKNPFLRERKKFTIYDAYMWALISGYSKLSVVLWEFSNDPISSALIGATILKNIAKSMLEKGYIDKYEEYIAESNHFQSRAVLVLDEAYRRDKEKTYSLLKRRLEQWNKITCLEIGLNGKMLDFLNHSACKSYAMKLWMGEAISTYTSDLKIIWAIMCFITIPSLMTNPVEKEAHNDRSLHAQRKIDFCSALKKFYTAPIVKFYLYIIFYTIFLTIFSFMNISTLRPFNETKIFWPEIFVYVYVAAFICEEIRQIFEESQTTLYYKFEAYINESWNLFDILIILLFITGIVLRFVLPHDYFIFCRCAFAFCLSAFYIRLLQMFFVSKNIGPKVIMIRKMLVDVLFFLTLFGVFLVAYGTLMQSIAYPNSEVSITTLKDIFYLPYFQTYGELMLDDLHGFTCNNTDWCSLKRSVVLSSFAIFLLLTNVVLINLLIAMFGYTFNNIQVISEKFYSFIRFQIVKEFKKKPPLPPPFSIICYLFIVCWKAYNKKPKTEKIAEKEVLEGFEKMCRNMMENCELFHSIMEPTSLNNNLDKAIKKRCDIPKTSDRVRKSLSTISERQSLLS